MVQVVRVQVARGIFIVAAVGFLLFAGRQRKTM